MLEKKIEKEKREKLENYEIVIKRAEHDIRRTKYTIEKELIEKHKLLNDPNEITRNAAAEVYEKYLKCSEKEKRAGPNSWK
jgi:hypothetical protein